MDITTIDIEYRNKYQELIGLLKKKKKVDNTELLDKSFQSLLLCTNAKSLHGNKDLTLSALEIATICIDEIGLGLTSIISLFLYLSDKELMGGVEKIEKEYSKEIALITEGLANVSKIDKSTSSSHAENYRRLLINLAKDLRVILIVLGYKLEHMRALKGLSEDEQILLASEASYLYAPLAHRLGLYLVKTEMEDISLKYTDSETYFEIAQKLSETMRAREAFINKFVKPIQQKLQLQGFNFDIKGRPKSIFSIWNKMKKKHVRFEDIYDLFAIRVILRTDIQDEKSDCWQVYSTVTDIYQPNPLRLRDWISVPKSNGYESLHTTVVGPDGKWVEVQIRTERMNEIAEKGVAAHWKYKGGEGEKGLDSWLSKIREILETPEPDASDFIDDFKLSLYSKEIFVFTPRGDLRKFPVGATVLDFAYDVHTQVGSTCTGGKLNGKIVPIRHTLQNGDKVEILTAKTQKPKLDWLNFVETSRAQKKIRQYLNEEKVKEAENGKEIIKRRFKNWKIDYSDEVIRKLLKKYKLPNAQEMYCNISTGEIDIAELKDFVIKEINGETNIEELSLEELESSTTIVKESSTDDFMVINEKIENVDYKLANCCKPIMGDRVFGFVTINEGIKIHRKNCPNAKQLIGKYGYRVVDANWTRKGKGNVFPVDIRIEGEDQTGILNSISEVITKDQGVNVKSIKLDSGEGAFAGIISMQVRDLSHLDMLLNKLNNVKGIYSASRGDAK